MILPPGVTKKELLARTSRRRVGIGLLWCSFWHLRPTLSPFGGWHVGHEHPEQAFEGTDKLLVSHPKLVHDTLNSRRKRPECSESVGGQLHGHVISRVQFVLTGSIGNE